MTALNRIGFPNTAVTSNQLSLRKPFRYLYILMLSFQFHSVLKVVPLTYQKHVIQICTYVRELALVYIL